MADINGVFSGEYDQILARQDGEERKIVLDDAMPLVVKPKNVTELDRLAHVVHRIEAECHIVPEGAYKYTPLQEVRPNEAFGGVSKEAALDLSKYVHFAPIQL